MYRGHVLQVAEAHRGLALTAECQWEGASVACSECPTYENAIGAVACANASLKRSVRVEVSCTKMFASETQRATAVEMQNAGAQQVRAATLLAATRAHATQKR